MDDKRVTTAYFAVLTSAVLSNAFCLVAKLTMPASGTPISVKDVICKYPSDHSIIWGGLCAVSIFAFLSIKLVYLFYFYNGQPIPIKALRWLTSYLLAQCLFSLLAEALVIHATISQAFHRARNVHHNLETTCPTAKKRHFDQSGWLVLTDVIFWWSCEGTILKGRVDDLQGDPHYRPGGNRNERTPPERIDSNKVHPVSEDAA